MPPKIHRRNRKNLKFRLDEHRGYINSKDESQPIGLHFNLPGHTLANMKATVIEQVKIHDKIYRKEREQFYIQKFDTFHKGMNKQKWRVGLISYLDFFFK